MVLTRTSASDYSEEYTMESTLSSSVQGRLLNVTHRPAPSLLPLRGTESSDSIPINVGKFANRTEACNLEIKNIHDGKDPRDLLYSSIYFSGLGIP